MDFVKTVESKREYFYSEATKSLEFRLEMLKKLKVAIKENEEALYDALEKDLNKSRSESYLCEIGLVYDEINYHLKHLKKWMKIKKVRTPLAQFKSKSFIASEPYGVVLIMAPWNYPVQLCFEPLIGAISAGNCAVLKPSNYSKNVSNVINKIISSTFNEDYISVVEGGRNENCALLDVKFDYIFFTGSVSVGKLVMERASKFLTPVSLELGGKSPVIVCSDANISLTAKRIAFGKVLNAGQTCVAPDYVLIHKSIKNDFIEAYKKSINEFFNNDYSTFPKIINEKHFDRLCNLMEGEDIVLGGECNKDKLFIAPTLINNISFDSKIMNEEIFGPLLPLIEFDELDECITYINSKPKPLAFYLFTKSKNIKKKLISSISFGGGSINDTIIHLATPYMGFGGVGESGMGAYHGKKSFETFSHFRSIVDKSLLIDLKVRYRPYSDKKDKIIKKLLK